MKNEADIIKLMDLLYGEGEAAGQATTSPPEEPELAQELEDLREVRAAFQSLPTPEAAPPMPLFMPSYVATVPPVRRLYWPYWAAASVALILFGFALAKVQVRYDAGQLTLAFGQKQTLPLPLEQKAAPILTAADTQAIQALVRGELAAHYTQLEESITQAQAALRKDNDSQRLRMVTQLQAELLALNKQQQAELSALVAATQADNLGKMVLAVQNVHSQQQEKLKWVLQQGFIDWNEKRENDLERIKDEFNKVYAQVHYQKLEQDKFNRVIIQQTNN
jgi:hypothetical protein